MQTFLPYSSFEKSAKSLDIVRLRKQRLEAFQILSALRDPQTLEERTYRGLKPPTGKAWTNHPAARMWRGHEEALRLYFNVMLKERISGTFRYLPVDYENLKMPKWFGNQDLHASHRSRLHYKGTIDQLTQRIKSQDGVRSAKAWLKDRGFPEMNVLKRSQRDEANSILDGLGVDNAGVNWYDSSGWSEANTYLPYLWPLDSTSNITYTGTVYDE